MKEIASCCKKENKKHPRSLFICHKVLDVFVTLSSAGLIPLAEPLIAPLPFRRQETENEALQPISSHAAHYIVSPQNERASTPQLHKSNNSYPYLHIALRHTAYRAWLSCESCSNLVNAL